MSTAAPRRILVGVDYSSFAQVALDRAIQLAARDPETELHALTVAEGDGPRLPPELVAGVKRDLEQEMKASLGDYVLDRAQHCDPKGLGDLRPRIHAHARIGFAADRLVQLARELDAEIVVVGTHGRRGLRRLVVGSVAEEVVRRAGCPVLVVRERDHAASAAPVDKAG